MRSHHLICIFFALLLPLTLTLYTSEKTSPQSPCVYGYHFSSKMPNNVHPCYDFNNNSTLVEGLILELQVYFPKSFVTGGLFSRCGECLELSSTGGESYRVMIAGYHTESDPKIIYGTDAMFEQLSAISDEVGIIPVSFQFTECPFGVKPSLVIKQVIGNNIVVQPVNTVVQHNKMAIGSDEYLQDILTGTYTIPVTQETDVKLVSLQRITIVFPKVHPKLASFQALTQFPRYTTNTQCQFIPENLLFENNTELEHLDELFVWQLYRVTPSLRLVPITFDNGEFTFSFSTENIQVVLGYPSYFQLSRYFSLLEFRFISDCAVTFEEAELFTLADLKKFDTDKKVKCSNVLSSFRSKEYKNSVGNVVLYGNLLKINVDSTCSEYVNFVSIKLLGVIGGTVTVNRIGFQQKESLNNVMGCNASSAMCHNECSSSNEECQVFCGKCPAGKQCVEGSCVIPKTNTRSGALTVEMYFVVAIALFLV
ncbi:hypothetical protein EIN_064480 [Entamoeba invadens IP1]|uniref:Uncharacterized protein n=1 Tax=Entamoeba invadens IP1 TaxID=370355 RepID=A0A0A1U004_ENTIV|nr:hypothetical protein EIN_064480 [Entamoeba invadens IP1]ELP84223.1 hypothetical protein EIN_064480 [Entamoeba invadens IP1]|eukprot:XP_004183569.1 hypothetical protein EIN_064480 [Entamoeba invadens IP1]